MQSSEGQGLVGSRIWSGIALRRRWFLSAFTLIPTAFVAVYMNAIFTVEDAPFTVTALFLVIYVILFSWILLGFLTAVVGSWLLWRKNRRADPWHPAGMACAPRPDTQVAILIPINHEEVSRVLAGIESVVRSLQKTADFHHFTFFILSDSREPEVWVKEELLTVLFAQKMDLMGRLHYRRRSVNLNAKSGNVADWCRRWGVGYEYMIVFDADSIMSGATLSRLLHIMEGNPRVGILQTQPISVMRETLYARFQQFAGRLYGPLFSAGLQFWQLGDGHYIGHNAILRTKPFRECCALPIMPGRQPFGGHLLSHDFVESALMAKHGWEVWFLPDIGGSYEENPPTLFDELKRDRRWAQGNTQHLSLLLVDGLRSAHRFLFLNGAMAFLAAPLWGILLVVSITLAISGSFSGHGPALRLFFKSFPLPPWWLFALTLFLLISPKILSIIIVLRTGLARQYGGIVHLLLNVMFETVLSIFISPVKMLFHSLFVLQSLLGKSVKWGAQVRDDRSMSWAEAIRYFGWCSAFGGGVWASLYWIVGMSRATKMTVAIYPHLADAQFIIWLIPILGGMVLAVPIAVVTSRISWGTWAKNRSIFLIPEEINPPEELRLTLFNDPRLDRDHDPFIQAVIDPELNAIHAALHRSKGSNLHHIRGIMTKALTTGPWSLSDQEKNILLRDRQVMIDLHWAVWGLTENREAWHGQQTFKFDPETLPSGKIRVGSQDPISKHPQKMATT